MTEVMLISTPAWETTTGVALHRGIRYPYLLHVVWYGFPIPRLKGPTAEISRPFVFQISLVD
jgi:hypothetical protein